MQDIDALFMQDHETPLTADTAVFHEPLRAKDTLVEAPALRALLSGGMFSMLRMPPALEKDFRRNYRDRSATLLRRSVYGLIALYLLVVVPVALLSVGVGQSTWVRYAVLPIGIVLLMVWISTRVSALQRHVETTLGIGVFICLAGTIYGATLMGNTFFGQVASYETIYVLIVAFSVLRLPTRISIGGSLAAFALAFLLSFVTGVPLSWLNSLLFFFVPLLICAINGYMLEYAARRDFVQTLCHSQEKALLLQDMAAVGNDAGDVQSMLEFALARICTNMGWIAGHACLIDPKEGERDVIRHVAVDADSNWFAHIEAELPPTTFSSLISKVLHLDRAAWSVEPVSFQKATRLLTVKTTRLAFPVRVDIDIAAVLEFVSPRHEQPDEHLLTLMDQVGQQLSRAIESRRLQQQLKKNALLDVLTGLPNRTCLFQHLRIALSRAKRRDDYRFGVLFIDVDRFKWVNDSLGHNSGDQLLQEFGRRLQCSVRPGDIVARLGGDEFAVLLDDVDCVADAVEILKRFQLQLDQSWFIADHEIDVGASAGVVMYSPQYVEPEELLRDADTAMYRAKHNGRGGHVVFADGMREQAMDRLKMLAGLRRAIDGDQLVLHYQPIVSLDTGIVNGFEALVRWDHPELGMIAPDQFIPLAEETGLVMPLTQWVLEEACRQLGVWQQLHPASTPLGVSVNLCANYFAQTDMPDRVQSIMQSSGVRRGSLRLEITETQIIANAEICMHNINRLDADDVRVYIDDFGTGYSSLNYLANFKVNALKIDRSFMNGLEGGGKEAIVVRAITSLSRHLGLDVIAEGVETPEQLLCLQNLGCQYVQGYFLSHAVSAEKAGGLIGRQLTPGLAQTQQLYAMM